MSDDLLRALGRHQRHELDEPDALDDDDELLQPFDDATRDALLDGLDRACEADPSATTPASSITPITPASPITDASPLAPASPTAPADAGAKVIDLSLRRRAAVAGILLASAAALAFVIWGARDRPKGGDAIALLPAYETSEVRGGKALQRGEPDEAALVLAPSDELDWVVTPSEPVTERPAVVLIAEAPGHTPRFASAPAAEVSESGAIRVRARVDGSFGDAPLEPGEWTLTLLIAPAAALPRTLAEAEAAGPWQRVAVRVTIVAPP